MTEDGCLPNNEVIQIHSKNGSCEQFPINSEDTDPITYPIWYPYGGCGRFRGMKEMKGHICNYFIALLCSFTKCKK